MKLDCISLHVANLNPWRIVRMIFNFGIIFNLNNELNWTVKGTSSADVRHGNSPVGHAEPDVTEEIGHVPRNQLARRKRLFRRRQRLPRTGVQ